MVGDDKKGIDVGGSLGDFRQFSPVAKDASADTGSLARVAMQTFSGNIIHRTRGSRISIPYVFMVATS
jgi:hypothetical protein